MGTIIYVLAALIPAIILMYYINKYDTIEKEPMSLLLRLLLSGVYAAFLALLLETFGQNILDSMYYRSANSYAVWTACMVGISEEISKYLFLRLRTWKNPNFNYRYDGLVYAVFVSLGFAAFENVLYVFQYGLGVAVSRALLAVPAHMAFGVFMGSFYGRAKVCEAYGDKKNCSLNLLIGVGSAIILHSFYDACVMMESDIAFIIFSLFVIAMYIIVIRKIKHESRSDYPI
ncbi:MAG: PrsW family intramembrane metalloprotease [Solobacterium sp.]|nr:PrsW family intramembrane metalloprotease [Solobacterium sp.]